MKICNEIWGTVTKINLSTLKIFKCFSQAANCQSDNIKGQVAQSSNRETPGQDFYVCGSRTKEIFGQWTSKSNGKNFYLKVENKNRVSKK